MIAAAKLVIIGTKGMEQTTSLIRHQISSLLLAHQPCEVFPKVERDALRAIEAGRDVFILPAEKRHSVVVLDRTNYLQNAKNVLEDR
ncbi:unnamed protein product [Dibothriocephalus latus]|uniref:Uncharacterized protein n=1 Tax=Dibothriocephalus latus TaxID=60516 RepID=A0A3P6UFB2_DIBLA|nr:unnamed protein product [Dibothriocephalus latus]